VAHTLPLFPTFSKNFKLCEPVPQPTSNIFSPRLTFNRSKSQSLKLILVKMCVYAVLVPNDSKLPPKTY
ncbi:uncharacterized protein METZ01_LOCUS396851, partial [marine metagenome]